MTQNFEGQSAPGPLADSAAPAAQTAETPDVQSALANGLPTWNIEPPETLVRRKGRRI